MTMMKTSTLVVLAALATATNSQKIDEITVTRFESMNCGSVGESSTLTMGFTAHGAKEGLSVVNNVELFYNWGSESYVVTVFTNSSVGNPAETSRSSVAATWTQGEDFLNFTAVETYVYPSSGIFDTKLGFSFSAVDSRGKTWNFTKDLELKEMVVEEDSCVHRNRPTEVPSASPTFLPDDKDPTSGARKAGEWRFYLTLSLLLVATFF